MAGLKNLLISAYNWAWYGDTKGDTSPLVASGSKSTVAAPLPGNGGRVSRPDNDDYQSVINRLEKGLEVVNTEFNREIIPVIRKLAKINPNVSQALQNVCNLGNTGHIINFDRNVSDEYAAQMRNHIVNKHKDWAAGCAGADGLVNKMLAQAMIGGATSHEWIPKADLSGIETVAFVNPEDIFFVLDRSKTKYAPYQRLKYNLHQDNARLLNGNLLKLNPLTYRYYALNGDTDTPNGFPPYMSALGVIDTQSKMYENIDYVVRQMGLLGFLEVLIQEPEQMDGENDEQYAARLEGIINLAKTKIDQGFNDGTLVGYIDKHEFKFNSIAKDFASVVDLFKLNELQIFSALKHDATLAGRDYNTSESQIAVIFMKMLSELKNIQNVIKTALEYGYALELRLAGFKFDYLNIEFKRSTIQDDLKAQQALEYKIKNYTALVLMGTISTKQFANAFEFEAPDQDKPRVSWEVIAGGSEPKPDDPGNTRKDQKGKSAKKTRDKAKPQGSKKST